MTSTWLRATLLLALTFVLGGVVGFELGRGMRTSPTMATTNPMEPHAFVDRLGRDLNLDANQRTAIVAILTRRQSSIDSAWRALRPSVRATIDSAQAEIVGVLHPDQRGRYMALARAAHGAMMDSAARADSTSAARPRDH